MKNYKVNVNGTEYVISIELMSEDEAQQAKASNPVVESSTQDAPKAEAPKAEVPKANVGAGEKITAPMPGNILSVNVKEGDSVKKGQVLMILEAMKMENEIMSGSDGVVTSVSVQAGTAVETGTVLLTIA